MLLRLAGERLAAKPRERVGGLLPRPRRGRRLEHLLVALLGELVVAEAVRDLGLDELRGRLLDALDAGGEVLLVRVQLRASLRSSCSDGTRSPASSREMYAAEHPGKES